MSARLSKQGSYVLCGTASCGARLGQVEGTHPNESLVLFFGYAPSPSGSGRTFAISSSARARIKHGQMPSRRGQYVAPPNAVILCWRCEAVNIVDAAELHVGALDDDRGGCFRHQRLAVGGDKAVSKRRLDVW